MVEKTDKQRKLRSKKTRTGRALQDMLLDALHAMRSQEEADELRKPTATKPSTK